VVLDGGVPVRDNAAVTALPDVLVPDGTRLLHIGPHKTGTSSLQSAFHRGRRGLTSHGVLYAGPNRQPLRAAQAAAAIGSPEAARRPIQPWHELLREIRASRAPRAVISSEWFADARDDAIRRIVDDLDPARAHVVVTVRPLASILPSQWQQHVQAGLDVAYGTWLESVFGGTSALATTFWRRHRHDALIERWAAAAGPANVSVVVADDRDHGAVLRTFERLVGLPVGLLVAERDRSNRSLTGPEVELIRALNVGLGAWRIEPRVRLDLVLFGAAGHLRGRMPGSEEARIETPEWAVARAVEAGREIAAGIARSGVRVLGDLDTLAAPGSTAPTRAAAADAAAADAAAAAGTPTWPDIAATTAMGVLLATGLARQARAGIDDAGWPDPLAPARDRPAPVNDAALAMLSTPRLAAALSARLREAFQRSVRGHQVVPEPSVHSDTAEVV
jgi:hypothetical protein